MQEKVRAPSESRSSPVAPGTVVARRYSIEAKLGKGGIGAVYLASDLHAGGRAVALKILREDRLDADRERGLRSEYAMLARLRHPHIETVFDFGRDAAHGLYIAKEYLSGADLMRATEKLTPEQCLQLSMQLFRALAFLHARGLIHNDIKPDNVLVVKDPEAELERRAVLIDFGIASQGGPESTEQTPGGLVGTLGYMAPERVRGVAPNARTDLYAAGILLYRLLTRSFPFDPKAQAAELLAFHLYGQARRPSEMRPGIPPAMDDLVERLLRKDPEQRFASAHEVLEDIAKLLGKAESVESEASQEGYVRSVPLVGRDRELDLLTSFVERRLSGEAKAGEPAMAVLVGGPGMGKSRLLAEILVRARLSGAHILTGSGRKLGGGLGPLRAPLRRLMTEEEAQRARAYLDSSEHEGKGDRSEVLSSLATLILERGGNTVIAIEDLHNTDDLTLDLLALTARRLRDSEAGRLCVLVTARDATRLRAYRDALLREGVARETALQPLTLPETQAFAGQALGQAADRGFVRALHSRTGGEPQALQEALKLLLASGVLTERTWKEPGAWGLCIDALPQGTVTILTARLALLKAEARATLKVLALSSRPLPLQLLASGADLPPQLASSLLSDLAKRELVLTRVADSELYYLLAHDRMAQAALLATGEDEVRGIHRSLAKAMEELPEKYGEDWLVDLAYHAIHSGDPSLAASHGQRAGRKLEALYAWDQALEIYEALALVPELPGEIVVDALLRTGGIHEHTGDYRNAMRSLARAARKSLKLGLPAGRAAALQRAAVLADRQGQRWKAEVRATKARMLYEQIGDRLGVASVGCLMAEFLCADKDYKRALKLATKSRRLYEDAGDWRGLGQALQLKGTILWRQGNLDEATHYYKQAHRISGGVGALASWGRVRSELGDFGEADRIFKEALDLATRESRLREGALVQMLLGIMRREQGEIREAHGLLVAAADTFEALSEVKEGAAALAALSATARDRGRYEEAHRHVNRALELLEERSQSQALGDVLYQSAALAYFEGDFESARKWALRAAKIHARWEEARALGHDRLGLADIARECGRREDFVREVFEARSVFGMVQGTSGLLHTDLCLARGEKLWGNPREALRQLEECLKAARSQGLRGLGAQAAEEIASLHHELGDDGLAHARIAEALAYAQSVGAAPLEASLRLEGARLHLAHGAIEPAMAELSACDAAAQDARNMFLVHEALTLRALCLCETGHAREALAQAASLAQAVRPRAMVRLIIEADLLLARIAERAGEARISEAAERRVLAALAQAGFRRESLRV